MMRMVNACFVANVNVFESWLSLKPRNNSDQIAIVHSQTVSVLLTKSNMLETR